MSEHEYLHEQGMEHTHGHDTASVRANHSNGTHRHDASSHPHDHVSEHAHEGEHVHMHGHNHPNQKAVSNRLARAIGHLEKVRRMVDDGEDCAEILIQLAAVRSAINNAGKVLLQDHISHCIVEAVEDGDMEKIDELNEAIRKFM